MGAKVSLADVHTGRIVETITASRDHPFYVRGKGFVPAGGLAIGNAIVTRAGPEAVVAKVEWLRKPGGYTVYNFEVEKDHTYFVGKTAGGAWVHNPGPLCAAQESAVIRRIQNAITKHSRLGPKGEVSGAILDLQGTPVAKPGGGYYDHLNELEEAMNGLEKNAEILLRATTPAGQAARQQALDHLEKIWDELGKGLYP